MTNFDPVWGEFKENALKNAKGSKLQLRDMLNRLVERESNAGEVDPVFRRVRPVLQTIKLDENQTVSEVALPSRRGRGEMFHEAAKPGTRVTRSDPVALFLERCADRFEKMAELSIVKTREREFRGFRGENE